VSPIGPLAAAIVAVALIAAEKSERRANRSRYALSALILGLVVWSCDLVPRLIPVLPSYAPLIWIAATFISAIWFLRTMVQRVRDIGRPEFTALLVLVPVVNFLFLVMLLFTKGVAKNDEALSAFD
jgi:hypothetical protein